MTNKQRRPAYLAYYACSVLLSALIIAVLLAALSYMPPFGNPDNPANNEVYSRYIERGVSDTGAVNIVASISLDYRAFDTLGEAFILFTAMTSVILLIRATPNASSPKTAENNNGTVQKQARIQDERQPPVLRVIVMITAPFVIILGIYVIFNGHLSPGGGFSGGAILGAGLSLWAIAFGTNKVRELFSFKTYTICTSVALLFYAIVKGYSFFMGASGLSAGIPLGAPGNILSAGLILPLNICVGIVVACTVYSLYSLFSEGEV